MNEKHANRKKNTMSEPEQSGYKHLYMLSVHRTSFIVVIKDISYVCH